MATLLRIISQFDKTRAQKMHVSPRVSVLWLLSLVLLPLMAGEEAKAEDVDVVVVGSGIAGMTAAYELRKADPRLDVRVLEAHYRTCGRLYSAPVPTANGTDRWDLGGQWVGHTQVHVWNLLEELHIPTYPQYSTGINVGFPHQSPEVDRIMRLIEEKSLDFTPNDPFAHPMAEEWNRMTLDDFVIHNGGGVDARLAVNSQTLEILDSNSDDISLVYFLMYLNSQGSNLSIIHGQTGDGAVANRIFNGASTLCETIQALLPQGAVSIYDPVTSIIDKPNYTQVVTQSRRRLNARRGVVLAVPPNQLLRIGFTPPLSDAKRSLLAGFYSKLVPQTYKYAVTYPQAFWRAANFSGNMVIGMKCNTSAPTPSCLPALMVLDGMTSKGSPALVGFATFFEAWLPQSARKRLVLAALSDTAFGPRTQTDAIAYADDQWQKETYARGCVPSIRPSIMNKDYPRLARAPIGRLHFAGTYTATIWMGKMSGAVQSGQRVADEILNGPNTPTPTPSSAIDEKYSIYSICLLIMSCLIILGNAK